MAETNRKELKRMFMIEKGGDNQFSKRRFNLPYTNRYCLKRIAKFKDNYSARVNLENQ